MSDTTTPFAADGHTSGLRPSEIATTVAPTIMASTPPVARMRVRFVVGVGSRIAATADSALHAPQAGFGDTDFHPDMYDKAAVLARRIAWNHPLPDGNKRAAWACLLLSST